MTLTTNKRCLLSILALLAFFSIVSAHEQGSDNYTMPKDVLSNGGDKSNSSNYKMVATVGQNATKKGTANGNVLYSGFYAPRSTRSPKSNCTGVTEGLVACYPFDGNANDGSGNGNHGVENGTIEYIEGKIGQAVKLNGNLSYIRVPNPEQKFEKQYSITGWVSTNGRGMPILAKYSWNGSARGFAIHSTTPDGAGVTTNGSTIFPVAVHNESYNPKKFPNYTLPINEFKYVSAIYDGGYTKLYIDGVLVNESTVQHSGTLDNPYDMLIGAYWHNHGTSLASSRTFDGIIDDLRVYNRVLSESEIKQLYDGTEEPCEPELSVEPLYRVLHWWQVQTPFELQNKTTCKMDWTIQANRLTVSPTSGTDDATLNAMMYPSWWFNVGTFTTTAPNAIGSPTHNLVIQPGLWWWWRYWVMQLISGRIHPNQAIPHIIAINRIMRGPMIFRVRWPGSDLDLKITTPSGQTLTQDSPEVLKVHEGDTEEYWLVESEETGDWQVEVVGIEVDVEGEDYQLEIVANERSEPPTEDTDNDGLSDEWETYFLGDLTQDGNADSDGDGVSNLREFQEGINPTSGDTDGDGKPDVQEIANYTASGIILDKEGNPVAGVTVQIGDKTALTDAAGNWEITDLAESNYTVTASKDGYIFGSKDFAVGNDQNASVSIKAESVLDVKVKSDPSTAQQGENITYTITVTNNDSEIATGVVLTDTLPTDTSLVSIEALDGGDCSAETVSCTLSDLTPGATATVKLVISNTQADQLLNTAKVTANNYPADVQITRTTVTPYFSVSLSDTPDPVTMGGTLHYTVEVDLSQFAPKDATGVELVLQLPSGVELENATTDHGTCDTSKLPTVTCTIDDLSVASAEAISHITVNLNVTLIDMGLLLLTHDAKVTSTDYPAHSVKERTKIFIGDVKVDMVFVIDTTNSMAAEINGVIVALRNFIEKIDPSKAPLIVLVEFKDDVRFKAATRDLDILLGAVEDLKAEGGGTCPEASAEALTLAIEHLKDGGVILFTTDASPYADADLEKLGKLMSGKDMNLVTILTGDCSNQDDWNVLP